jgi:hypothetical protein
LANDPLEETVGSTQIDLGGDDEAAAAVTDVPLELGNPGSSVYARDPKYRRDVAEKFSFGTGIDLQQVEAQLESGNEAYLRESVATQKVLEQRQEKAKVLLDVASKLDRPLTSADLDEFDALVNSGGKPDPQTVLEESYGNAFANVPLVSSSDSTVHRNVLNKMPDAALDTLDAVGQAVARREIAESVIQDLAQRHSEAANNITVGQVARDVGWSVVEALNPFASNDDRYSSKPALELIGDYGQMFLPAYTNLQLGGWRWSTGDSLEEQYRQLALLPPSEFKQAFQDSIDSILGDNPLSTSNLPLALQFARGYQHYSTSDQWLDNWFGYADWVGLAATSLAFGRKLRPIKGIEGAAGKRQGKPKGPKSPSPEQEDPMVSRVRSMLDTSGRTPEEADAYLKKARELIKKHGLESKFPEVDLSDPPNPAADFMQHVKDFRQAMKDTVKAANQNTAEDVAAQLGDIDLAAELRVNKELLDKLDNLDPFGDAVPLRNKLPGLFYPHEVGRNPGTMAREKTDRLLAHAVRQANQLLKTLANNHGVTRLSEEQAAKAIELAKEQMLKQYSHAQDAILDVDLGGPFRVYTPEEQLINAHTLEMRLGELPKRPKEAKPTAPTKTAIQRDPNATNRLVDYMAGSRDVSRGDMLNEIRTGYEEATEAFKAYKTPKGEKRSFIKFLRDNKAIGGQFRAMLQEISAATGKPITEGQFRRLQRDLSLGASPTGDEFIDAVNEITSKTGKTLARDVYDKLKAEGKFKGTLADFRQKVADARRAGTIKMSPYGDKIPQKAAPRKPRNVSEGELEEGNFASEYGRDIGYGNETYRNRIIDSEFIVRSRSKYKSAQRAHFIEPPSGFKPEVKANKTERPGRYPKANPQNEEELMEALNNLMQRLAKTEDTNLYNRIGNFLHKVEKRQITARDFNEDTRTLDPTFIGSPYGTKIAPDQLVETRRVKRGQAEEEKGKFQPVGPDPDPFTTQKGVPDPAFVGRDYSTLPPQPAKKRRISPGDKERFADLESRAWVYLNKLDDSKKVATEIKMGKPSASLFAKREQAAYYGKNVYGLSPNQFRIKQQGNGYYISIPKIVDETFDPVRDLRVGTENRPYENGFTALLGAMVSPDLYVDDLSKINRALVTYLPQEMHRLVQDAAKNLLKLPKEDRDELREMLASQRDYKYIDNEDKLRRGKFNETFGEFEREFYQRYKKLPTEQQVAAYFDFTRYYDLDLAFRDLALVRDMGRLGLERTTVGFHVKDPNGDPFRQQSRAFSSRQADELPVNDPDGEDWGVWIYNPHAKAGEFHLRSQLNQTVLDDIKDKTDNHGFKILELGNPLEKPLLGVAQTDEIINFIVVKDFNKAKYTFSNIPKRPGGHVAYQDEIFIKQPRMRKTDRGWIYEGDETLLNVTTEKQARTLAKHIDNARLLYKQGRWNELDDYLAKNTPFDRAQFESYFSPRTLPDGTEIPPRFSPDHEFTFTTKGRNTFDMSHFKNKANDYENFRDAIRSKYNLFANYVDKKYLGSRDPDVPAVLETKRRVGDSWEPEMVLTAPRLIDPYETINSSLANVIRSRYLNDAKMQFAEEFVEAFSSVMSTPKSELRRNPMFYLHNPVWDTSTDNWALIAHGKHYRQAALNLIGTDTELGKAMNWMYTKVTDGILDVAGQPAADKFTDAFRKSTNPVDFLRKMTFHTKLGLLNPVQAWKQGIAITHAMAIEDVPTVTAAVPEAFAARWLALTDDPKQIEGVIGTLKSTWGKQLGFDAERFREAYEELRKTGFYNVGGEYASRDDFFDPKVFKGAADEFLDKTAVAFVEGERFQRLVAWFVAYRRWKAANPNKVMNNSDRAAVTERAHFLTNRMARNSNANIQSGSFSATFQFMSYQWRMAEALLGKDLTRAQKLRVFLTYSALYGVPVGAAGFTVVGFYDDIRQYMLEEGYDMDNPAIQAVHEGIVSTGLSAILGEEYNFATSYGPSGNSALKDLFTGDTTWLEFIAGASGSVTGDMMKSTSAVYDFVMNWVDPTHDAPTAADFVEFTKNISSVNQALRAYYMATAQQYVTKNEGVVLNDTTSTDAIMQLLFGLTPNKVGDNFKMLESIREQKEAARVAEREAVKYVKRAMYARRDGDVLLTAKNMRRAKAALIAGQVPKKDWLSVLRKGYSGDEPLWNSTLKDFVRTAPQDQKAARREQAIEQLGE